MPRYARVNAQDQMDLLRTYGAQPDPNAAKGWRWLLCAPVDPPAFDSKTQVRTGPTYTVGASAVTEGWSVRSKTAQEIDADKDAAVDALGATSVYQVLLRALLELENDNRTIKAKINALITATGASTPPFTAGQAGQITMAQLKTAIKNLLS